MTHMQELLQKLAEKRNEWTDQKYIAGLLVNDFAIMKENALDIIFNENHPIVREYKKFLVKMLACDDIEQILLVHTEMERAYEGFSWENKLYVEYGDEIYHHFELCGNNYSIELLDVHIAVMQVFVVLSEDEMVLQYMNILLKTYEENFGTVSYLYSRNLCYIISRFMLPIMPRRAILKFEKNVDILSSALKNDSLLYETCMAIAAEKVNQEKKTDYIKEAVELCTKWNEQSLNEKKGDIDILINMMSAIYYRNIGEFDQAIKKFTESIYNIKDVHGRYYCLSQIASVLYANGNSESLEKFYQKIYHNLQNEKDVDENITYIYSIYAFFKAERKEYDEAENAMLRAINIARQLVGDQGELTFIHRCNKAMLNYQKGLLTEAAEELQQLYEIIIHKPEEYTDASILVINNLELLFGNGYVGEQKIRKLQMLLERKKTKYDCIDTIVLKTNLYIGRVVSGKSYINEESLRDELEKYYDRHPEAMGWIQFAEAEIIRFSRKGEIEKEKYYLRKIMCYVKKHEYEIYTPEYYAATIAEIKIHIYENDYTALREKYISLWKKEILDLCKMNEEKRLEPIYNVLHEYMSIRISLARQYPKLTTVEQLYTDIFNYERLIEKSVVAEKKEGRFAIDDQNEISIKDLFFDKEKLIIDTIGYNYIDFGSPTSILVNSMENVENTSHQIFFAIERANVILKNVNVVMLEDVSLVELHKKTENNSDSLLEAEVRIGNRLLPLLKNKNSIYVCQYASYIPRLAYLMFQGINNAYLVEQYPIIFSNSVTNIEDTLEITNLSDAYVFGMSNFARDCKKKQDRLEHYLPDIKYTEKEIQVIANVLQCKPTINQRIDENILRKSETQIIHLSSHTICNRQTGEVELVVGKNETGKLETLSYEQIAQAHWTSVKIVILSACATAEGLINDKYIDTLSQAVCDAGARSCIATIMEVPDIINAFYMVCFYKNLRNKKNIVKAYIDTQNIMRTITKKQIQEDTEYMQLDISAYLSQYDDGESPFAEFESWGAYVLQLN